MLSVDIIVIMPLRRSTPKTSKPSLKAKKKIIEVSKAIDIGMDHGIRNIFFCASNLLGKT